MSRAYAKAIFEFASESNALQPWRVFLSQAAVISQDERVRKAWLNPSLELSKMVALFGAICKDWPAGAENFIRLLTTKKRLGELPRIRELFEEAYSAEEKNVVVEVTTASPSSDSQQKVIEQALTRYFKQDITLTFTVDEKIVGGFVARAGDLVIDASLQNSLKELEKQLG
jgi:F-type H+-transporting ATPase subunit delta